MSTPPQRHTRRAFLKLAAAGILAGGGTATYSYWGERFNFVVSQHEKWLPTLPAPLDGLRVVHLTDLHHSRSVPQDYLTRVVSEVNRLDADLIVITGDYVTGNAARWMPPCAALLSALHAPLGVYATLGNHDEWTDAAFIAAQLSATGIRVLQNDGLELQPGLWLLGVGDIWEEKHDLPGTLARLAPPDQAAKILLAHEPDFADTVRGYPIDLQLSGHSHGGQIVLPFQQPRVLPWLGRTYPSGRYELGRLTLYTSRGIGVLNSVPFRFNCPPEVAVFTLRSGTPPAP